jgi:Tol biopolymer transport system component
MGVFVPAALAGLFYYWTRPAPLPAGVAGTLIFVSDRDGQEALYARALPKGESRRLTVTGEAARDPALSPDGSRLAFVMGGRVGLLGLPRGDLRFATLGVDHQDAQPAWRPDGKALVVASRAKGGGPADLVLLDLDTPDGTPLRKPLVATRGLDETSPRFSPSGKHVMFVREDGIFRLSLEDGRAQRLTTGFRKYRDPRFLPSGRLIALWSEDKRYGFESMDEDGKNRETLAETSVFYRGLAPSPDGRYLVATFMYDLGFRPEDALRPGKSEALHLLDERGRFLAVLEPAGRHASHSPEWGR